MFYTGVTVASQGWLVPTKHVSNCRHVYHSISSAHPQTGPIFYKYIVDVSVMSQYGNSAQPAFLAVVRLSQGNATEPSHLTKRCLQMRNLTESFTIDI